MHFTWREIEIFKVLASIVCILMMDSCWANLARESRGVHLTVLKGTGNFAAVASAVRSLNTKMDKQNEALNRLADATEQLATKTAPPSCIMTEKYGYTRIQLEPTSKPFDVFCEQAINEGGWTLVLQRFNGTSRTAQEYRNGYNSIQAGEYFLGTDKFYALTHSRLHELLFVMEFNNLTNSIFQAPRFVLKNPEAYSLWAQERETSRYSWTQWQNDAARLKTEESWIRYPSRKGLKGLDVKKQENCPCSHVFNPEFHSVAYFYAFKNLFNIVKHKFFSPIYKWIYKKLLTS